MLVAGTSSIWIVLARLGLACWRLAIDAQLHGATGLDMLATGDWRSAAALWAQCRYVGRVQISGHHAALWASITAGVYTANTRPSTIAMNHIRTTMTHTHDTDF